MAPIKSTPAKAATEPQKPTTEPQEEPTEPQEEKPQEVSKKAVKANDALWYRGDYGPVFALVTRGGEGEADVLLLRPDEMVRGRTVAVYDTAEDAERGYGGGTGHVAWHLS